MNRNWRELLNRHIKKSSEGLFLIKAKLPEVLQHTSKVHLLLLHHQQQKIWERSYQDEIKKDALLDLDKICIPGLDFFLPDGRLVISGLCGFNMVSAILYDLCQNLARDIGKWDGSISASICKWKKPQFWLCNSYWTSCSINRLNK